LAGGLAVDKLTRSLAVEISPLIDQLVKLSPLF